MGYLHGLASSVLVLFLLCSCFVLVLFIAMLLSRVPRFLPSLKIPPAQLLRRSSFLHISCFSAFLFFIHPSPPSSRSLAPGEVAHTDLGAVHVRQGRRRSGGHSRRRGRGCGPAPAAFLAPPRPRRRDVVHLDGGLRRRWSSPALLGREGAAGVGARTAARHGGDSDDGRRRELRREPLLPRERAAHTRERGEEAAALVVVAVAEAHKGGEDVAKVVVPASVDGESRCDRGRRAHGGMLDVSGGPRRGGARRDLGEELHSEHGW